MSRSGSRTSTSRVRVRCLKCSGCYLFAKDCPNVTMTEKYQTDETYGCLTRVNLEEMNNHLN